MLSKNKHKDEKTVAKIQSCFGHNGAALCSCEHCNNIRKGSPECNCSFCNRSTTVIVPEDDWKNVTDLIFNKDGNRAEGVESVESGWTMPFKVRFYDKSVANVFYEMCQAMGVKASME